MQRYALAVLARAGLCFFALAESGPVTSAVAAEVQAPPVVAPAFFPTLAYLDAR